jgi:hypothetical protein
MDHQALTLHLLKRHFLYEQDPNRICRLQGAMQLASLPVPLVRIGSSWTGEFYEVVSETTGRHRTSESSCSCPDHQLRGAICSHIELVRVWGLAIRAMPHYRALWALGAL